MGYRKIRAKVCTWGVAEKDDKDRKGEVHAGKMGPLTNKKHTTGHLLLPIPVVLPSSFRAPISHSYTIPTLFSTWRSQAVMWDGQPTGVVE